MRAFCRKTVNEETTDRYVKQEDNINVDNEEEGHTGVGCTQKVPVNKVMEKSGCTVGGEFTDQLSDYQLLNSCHPRRTLDSSF